MDQQISSQLGSRTLELEREDFISLFELYAKNEWLNGNPSALRDLWITAENDKEKYLIKSLIENYCYVSYSDLLGKLSLISNHIEKKWRFSPSNTTIVACSDDDKPDGSQYILQLLKNKFSANWNEKNFTNSLPVAAHNVQNNSNIVLVDDFIGTGNALDRKVTYFNSVLEGRKIDDVVIKVVCVASMSFGNSNLSSKGLEVFYCYLLGKGISEVMNEDERPLAIKSMDSLESKLKRKNRSKRLSDFSFGYKRSESLFAIEGLNVPNNVFPVFWWPFLKGGFERTTIFKRL